MPLRQREEIQEVLHSMSLFGSPTRHLNLLDVRWIRSSIRIFGLEAYGTILRMQKAPDRYIDPEERATAFRNSPATPVRSEFERKAGPPLCALFYARALSSVEAALHRPDSARRSVLRARWSRPTQWE